MGAILALLGAAAYGTADFIGGLASRRTTPWPVALLACVGGTIGTLLLAVTTPGTPTADALAWGALAGVGSGVGSGFLYRGFASGRMGVVAPVSGVCAAGLPVLVGVLVGERPSALAWLGLVVAVPGIWLVSYEPGPAGSGSRADGLVDGLLAGLGFGVLFAALSPVERSSGSWPLFCLQAVSVVVLAALAYACGADPVPRRRSQLWGLVSGGLSALAVFLYALALRETLLSIASVIVSLYPGITILLATTVGERLHRTQTLGLLLCAVCVVCVSL